MPIRFTCQNPNCLRTLKAVDEDVGKKGKCPNCLAVNTVPDSQFATHRALTMCEENLGDFIARKESDIRAWRDCIDRLSRYKREYIDAPTRDERLALAENYKRLFPEREQESEDAWERIGSLREEISNARRLFDHY